MNREPVNTDDPQMTAYALGELSIAESVEFEAKLKESPLAARELSEMNAVMGLLSKGLAREWENEPVNSGLDVISHDDSNVVVEGFFGHRRKALFAAAAAVAMVAVVGSSFVSNSGTNLADVQGASAGGKFAMSAASQDKVMPANAVDRGDVANVPQLFLAEEVDDMVDLQLATAGDSIDATYLDATSIIPAAYQSGSGDAVHGSLLSRVDSYLPPVADQGSTEVTIENRLGERMIASADDQSDRASVFIRGFVSMDGSDSYFDSGSKSLASFKPVSISGNPVQSGEMDLKILSELSGVQRELERVVSEMPASAERRSQLIEILNRNREAVSELKREFSQ